MSNESIDELENEPADDKDTFYRVDENQEKTRFYDSDIAELVHSSCSNPLDLTK